jgi:hypothetical protein
MHLTDISSPDWLKYSGVLIGGEVLGVQEELERTLPIVRTPQEYLPDGFR